MSSEDQYQEMLNAIARDIRHKNRKRVQRQLELETMRNNRQTLLAKRDFFDGQLRSFNEYIEQSQATMHKKGFVAACASCVCAVARLTSCRHGVQQKAVDDPVHQSILPRAQSGEEGHQAEIRFLRVQRFETVSGVRLAADGRKGMLKGVGRCAGTTTGCCCRSIR